jgi:hypothetical protein
MYYIVSAIVWAVAYTRVLTATAKSEITIIQTSNPHLKLYTCQEPSTNRSDIAKAGLNIDDLPQCRFCEKMDNH